MKARAFADEHPGESGVGEAVHQATGHDPARVSRAIGEDGVAAGVGVQDRVEERDRGGEGRADQGDHVMSGQVHRILAFVAPASVVVARFDGRS